MILTLTTEEQEVLQHILESYLSDLRVQIAHTDNPRFKVRLRNQEHIVQGLIERLSSARLTN